ncbi:diguanylate cyclase [Candidatus Reidiella endopervernicosa]|uniref:Diguanylate cyclase n=1 Tax=Candidatus Reidiella endopervernicosa TaxID=2738883 RepID=A0A6N0HRI3_9GAMM|nr:diguanylate cyclase [Candidatus Reidiella endopervernicosa]
MSVGASIGVALYPENAEEADALIVMADQAMYRAKRQGKSCTVFFGEW